ncbi:WD40 repeat domain-containing protein [Mesorhizobium sp. M0619]|uniref:WD40 repeat domain-containing protein n=1 Tax=unclassified Mesorhizobium TaxID=325217 RepID=UPI003339AC11
MDRLAERLFALPLLAAALACLVRAYLLLGDRDFSWSGIDHMLHGPATLRPVVFLTVGGLCLLGALLFWAGLLPGRRSQPAGTPLFGRDAEIDPKGRPGLRRAFLMLPVLAVLALLADHFPWARDAGPGAEVAAPNEPKAEPKDQGIDGVPPDLATPPAPPSSPQVTMPPEPTPPVQAAKPPEPAQPTPPAAPPQPPQVALAPATPPPETAPPPAPATPPQTVAPLPPPPPALPTEPDGHRDAVVWLAVSADGRDVMSASTDHMIKLWDIAGKRLIRNLGEHKDMARTALFMPDGATALTAGDDGEIVLRKLADGAVLHVFSSGANGGVRKLAISPDGKRAVSGHDTGNVIVWDLVNKSVLHVMTGHDWPISTVAISPDGTRALSGSIDGTLKLWDVESGKQLRSWHGHEQGTYGAVFTADGHHVVTGSGDYTIKLWDLDTFRELRRFEGHEGTVYTLALSADGKRLASGSLDGTARLWDLGTGDQIAMFDSRTGPIYAVAFATDGTLVTGGDDRTIRDWPAAGGDGEILFAGAPQ